MYPNRLLGGGDVLVLAIDAVEAYVTAPDRRGIRRVSIVVLRRLPSIW
jgi:hypothetical protein